MHITLGQLASGTDTIANLAKMEAIAGAAAAVGSRLVVFPEYATYEKSRVDSTFVAAAQPLDGDVVQMLGDIARRHRLVVVAGIVETSDEPDRAHNTIVAVNANGELVAAYRKVHLFDSMDILESRHIKPATDLAPVTFILDRTVFGLLTCYDLRFPGIAQSLREAGAHVILAPSSWVPGKGKADQWEVLIRARALDNGVIVIGVSQAEPVSIGQSIVAGPLGEVIARCGNGQEDLTVNLPLETVQEARQQFPLSAQRRV